MSTDTESKTFDLEQVVADVAKRREDAERARLDTQLTEQQNREQQAVTVMRRVIEQSAPLTPEFLASVNPRYWYDRSESAATLGLSYRGKQWKLTYKGNGKGDPIFQIHRPGQSKLYSVPPHTLQDELLASFAEYRKQQESDNRHNRWQEEQQQAVAQQQKEQELRELEDAQACANELAVALSVARNDLWQWPEGVTMRLYKWRWQTGADSEGNCDYDEGYSLSYQLDEFGYVLLLNGMRELRLIPEVHRPVVERLTLDSVEALVNLSHATSLYTTKRLKIDGMIYHTQWLSDTPSLEGDHWKQFRHAAGELVLLKIGIEPIDAIKAVLR